MAQSFTGTVEYMAPEQMTGKNYSYSVDWYALGLVILEMLSGFQPNRVFPRPADHILTQKIMNEEIEIPSSLKENAADLVKKLLMKLPSDRIGCGKTGC